MLDANLVAWSALSQFVTVAEAEGAIAYPVVFGLLLLLLVVVVAVYLISRRGEEEETPQAERRKPDESVIPTADVLEDRPEVEEPVDDYEGMSLAEIKKAKRARVVGKKKRETAAEATARAQKELLGEKEAEEAPEEEAEEAEEAPEEEAEEAEEAPEEEAEEAEEAPEEEAEEGEEAPEEEEKEPEDDEKGGISLPKPGKTRKREKTARSEKPTLKIPKPSGKKSEKKKSSLPRPSFDLKKPKGAEEGEAAVAEATETEEEVEETPEVEEAAEEKAVEVEEEAPAVEEAAEEEAVEAEEEAPEVEEAAEEEVVEAEEEAPEVEEAADKEVVEAEEAAEEEVVEAEEEAKSLRDGLEKTRVGFIDRLGSLFRGSELDEEMVEEVEEILFTADIGTKIAQQILETVEEELSADEKRDPAEVWAFIRSYCEEVLRSHEGAIDYDADKPFVLLVIGVNGVGKTTTIGKIASKLKSQDKSVLLVAGDTFRAGAVDQLEIWARRTAIPMHSGEEGADPSSVIYDGIEKGVAEGTDVIICDTAGRLHTKSNLLDELGKMERVAGKALDGAPHETVLVLDANTGQNAIAQAKLFNEALDITGVVLTKLDGTAKGGVILGICDELEVPVRYIGIGEGLRDLRPFDAEEFVEALFM